MASKKTQEELELTLQGDLPKAKKEKAKKAVRKSSKARKPVKKLSKMEKELITKAIPMVNEQDFIIAPMAYTMMSHDYSAMQNKVVTLMLEKLQSVLHTLITKNLPDITQLGSIQEGDIKNDHGVSFNLEFKNFSVSKNHYPELRSALAALATLPVEIPYKSPEGRKYKKVTNLCDVFIPEGERTPYVNIHMDEDIARAFISVELGYHFLGKDVVYNTRNKYTQRIYFLISAWLKKGEMTFSTEFFRRILAIEDKYKSFRHVVQRVLDPAHDELRDMAELGYCNCYFEYDKVYNGRRKTGEPDYIHFRIYKSPKLKAADDEYRETGQKDYFCELLIQHFHLPKDKAAELAEHVSHNNYSSAMQKILSLEEYLKKEGDKIKNKPSYIYKSLDNFFREASRKTIVTDKPIEEG